MNEEESKAVLASLSALQEEMEKVTDCWVRQRLIDRCVDVDTINTWVSTLAQIQQQIGGEP